MLGKAENRLNSCLGAQTQFKGDLTVKGVLRIDGSVIGKIWADQLILSKSADVKGELHAGSIVVGGRVEGNLMASELVEIRAKGCVNGDVNTPKLLVNEGGEFNGRIDMKNGDPKVLDFDPVPTEIAAE